MPADRSPAGRAGRAHRRTARSRRGGRGRSTVGTGVASRTGPATAGRGCRARPGGRGPPAGRSPARADAGSGTADAGDLLDEPPQARVVVAVRGRTWPRRRARPRAAPSGRRRRPRPASDEGRPQQGGRVAFDAARADGHRRLAGEDRRPARCRAARRRPRCACRGPRGRRSCRARPRAAPRRSSGACRPSSRRRVRPKRGSLATSERASAWPVVNTYPAMPWSGRIDHADHALALLARGDLEDEPVGRRGRRGRSRRPRPRTAPRWPRRPSAGRPAALPDSSRRAASARTRDRPEQLERLAGPRAGRRDRPVGRRRVTAPRPAPAASRSGMTSVSRSIRSRPCAVMSASSRFTVWRVPPIIAARSLWVNGQSRRSPAWRPGWVSRASADDAAGQPAGQVEEVELLDVAGEPPQLRRRGRRTGLGAAAGSSRPGARSGRGGGPGPRSARSPRPSPSGARRRAGPARRRSRPRVSVAMMASSSPSGDGSTIFTEPDLDDVERVAGIALVEDRLVLR